MSNRLKGSDFGRLSACLIALVAFSSLCYARAQDQDKARDDSSKTLTCGDDKPDKGGYLFKAGTKENSHLVAIQPNGRGSLYQLLGVRAWGTK